MWKLEMPGPGGATPVVAEGRAFVTSQNQKSVTLIAFNLDGEKLWEKLIADSNRAVREDEGNSASASPVTDGKHVWALAASGELVCFTADGEQTWKIDLNDAVGKLNIQFGFTSTPSLHQGRLYLQVFCTGLAKVVCFNAATGETIWSHDRKSDARAECEHAYSSTVVYAGKEGTYLLVHGGDYVTAHSLDDGAELWRRGGINPYDTYNPTLRFVASPAYDEGIIVVPSAKNGPVLGIDPSAKGDFTLSEPGKSPLLWKVKDGTPDVPSPVVDGGLVYLCRENGVLICVDAKTGEQIYEKRVYADRHRASPLLADGKLFLCARDGHVAVIKTGRNYEALKINDLGESISASPIAVDGKLIIRTFNAIYCFGSGK